MNEKVAQALSHVDGEYVAGAARRKKHGKRILLSAVAAILTLVMITNLPTIPFIISAKAVAVASDSRVMERPSRTFVSEEKYDALFDEWYDARMEREDTARAAGADLQEFFRQGSQTFLTGEGNTVWSPVNASVALSVLAETAAGTTRQEVLDLLGVEDVQTLRRYISALWEQCHEDDGREISILASSLWLDDSMKYDQRVMDTLACDYYASVYQGDLGSGRTSRAIQNWVNNQTGGLLKRLSNGIDVSANAPAIETALALVSTVYLQATWNDEFSSAGNSNGIFHAPCGDRNVTYMNKKETDMTYYWGESYGAVSMGLQNGCTMWMLLPDEGKAPSDVLTEGEYLNMLGKSWVYENSKYMKVNLSVPKFDISANLDLKEGLQRLGLTEVFDVNGGDFGTTFETDLPIFVNRVDQASRVSIDEEGITAASYIVLDWGAGAAAPAEEIIDFVLDRPFVFVIESAGIPLFVGVVNEP